MKKQNQRVHNLLMSSKLEKGLYTYGKDGIYINFGYLAGQNLSILYRENEEKVLEYLEGIIENDNTSYKAFIHTVAVMSDLKKGWY